MLICEFLLHGFCAHHCYLQGLNLANRVTIRVSHQEVSTPLLKMSVYKRFPERIWKLFYYFKGEHSVTKMYQKVMFIVQ